MKDTELSIRRATLLATSAGVLSYLAIRFHVVRTIARFLGALLARVFFGNGRPR